MPDWQDIPQEMLSGWLAHWMQYSVPPTFALRPPNSRHFDDSWRAASDFGPASRRRPDSGVLELQLPTHQSLPAARVALSNLLHGVAIQEDDRKFRELGAPHSAVIVSEFESWLPGIDLPVIGPGGRITVATAAHGTIADIVIRRREKEIPSQWRRPQDLEGAIRQRIAQRVMGNELTNLTGVFGYLELSKYERQFFLQPVFLLSLRIAVRADADRRVEWADTVVEPATLAPGVSLADSLGSFA